MRNALRHATRRTPTRCRPYPTAAPTKRFSAAHTVEWAALHYGEGLSIRQIAQQTGISKSTVHRRVRALLYTHPTVRRCPACGRALCGTLPRPVVVGRIRQVGPMHFVYEERPTMSNHNPVT